ncbi:hypothetical protein JM79_2086 [Gramella sp. Hel_I_59]|nr:hypothetical protein JM79_2086 [Gramella sp. Hel_I_59]
MKITKYQKLKLIIFSAFSILFLFILHNYSNNGRFIFRGDSSVLLDTRNGTIYIPTEKTYVEINDFKKRN